MPELEAALNGNLAKAKMLKIAWASPIWHLFLRQKETKAASMLF